MEGTAAHEVAAELLESYGPSVDWVGKVTSCGVVVTQEMYEAAALYASHVHNIVDGDAFSIEQPLKVSVVGPDNLGTPIVCSSTIKLRSYIYGTLSMASIWSKRLKTGSL